MEPHSDTQTGRASHPAASGSDRAGFSGLDLLPPELLSLVFTNLDPLLLSTLRLVCKRWNAAVSNRETWTLSFHARFGTGDTFPLVSYSSLWLAEYFNRVALYKRWTKAVASHRSYQIFNNEFGFVDFTMASFEHDRLLTFSRSTGNVAVGGLRGGKIQTYIPGSARVGPVRCYAVGWNFVVAANELGEVYLRNLVTSTSLGARGSSLQRLAVPREAVNGNLNTFVPAAGNVSRLSLSGDTYGLNNAGLGEISTDDNSAISNTGAVSSSSRTGSQPLISMLTTPRLPLTTSVPSTGTSRRTSFSGTSHSTSPSLRAQEDEICTLGAISAVLLNSTTDKRRENPDIIAAAGQRLHFWALSGRHVRSVTLSDTIIAAKSDFKKTVVVLSASHIHVVDFRTSEMRSVEHSMDLLEDPFFDVDFPDSNSIIASGLSIKVVNFSNGFRFRLLVLPDILIRVTKLQSVPEGRTRRDPKLAGGDGLLCANILSDETVIVWDVRGTSRTIKVQTRISPVFHKFAPVLREGHHYLTSLALNSSIIAIGGYNGFTNMHNVFTGSYIKECLVKFPKKFTQMYSQIIPIQDIHLSGNQLDTWGVIICGDMVQYFQFGDEQKAKKKALGPQISGKQLAHQQIRDQMEDYDAMQETERQRHVLIDKYNGRQFEDEEEELLMALAISESYRSSSDDDVQLRAALEISLRNETPVTTSYEDDGDEELRRILELSLVDQ